MILRAVVTLAFVLAAAAVTAAGGQTSTSSAAELTKLLEDSSNAYLAGDPARGFSLLETVRARANADGLAATELEALLRLAQAYGFRNDYDRATEVLSRARTLAVQLGDRESEGRALIGLARIKRSRAAFGPRPAAGAPPDPETPSDLARAAWARFKAVGSARGMASAADALVYYLPDGPEKDAIRRDGAALTGADGRPIACAVYHEWADEDFSAGRLAEAYTHIVVARDCFHTAGERDAEARARVSLGRVYRAHGRLPEALAEYRAALALHDWPGSSDRRGLVQAMNAISVIYQLMGRYDDAQAQLEATLARARRDAPSTVPFLLANLAGIRAAVGRHAEALALIDEVLEREPATEFLPRRLTQRAAALAALGRREEAMQVVDRAIALADVGQIEGLVPRWTRARLLAEMGRFADAEADLRVAMDRIEQIRANTLSSDVMRRGFGHAQQDGYDAYIDVLGRQAKAADALEVAERARARAFLDLRAERGGGAAASAPASVAQAQAIAARLRSTIVAYWVGPTTLSIWVVAPQGPPRLVRVPVQPARLTTLVSATAGLEADAGQARGLLMTDRAQRAPWRELERLLIAPIAGLLPRTPGSRLTIVPHGPLFALSFAGLRQPSGGYLLESYDLHYVPAIAVLSATAAARASAKSGALVVGDPGPLAPELGGAPLPALPWARREIAAIRGTLGADATVLAADDATETRVRAALGGRRVLHFATHGVVSNEPSHPSFLALRPSADADGRLSADEIYDVSLDADLVVLSACRTALGPVEGDGVIGFTRAFLSGGARSVVATQWDVSDRVSFDVMREFYARRARGASKSRALRGAQLAVLDALRRGTVQQDGAALPEAPRLWAGFVLVGEP